MFTDKEVIELKRRLEGIDVESNDLLNLIATLMEREPIMPMKVKVRMADQSWHGLYATMKED